MVDQIRMDSHKLLFHPKTVSDWMEGKLIYPIEMEIGLSGACNHRCVFCAVDYMDYKPQMLDAEVLISNLKILGKKGLKSIIYAGEGEPLVNKNAPEIFNRTKEFGIDAAMSTNGVLFSNEVAKECMSSFSWIRFSIAGATDKTYEKIHQCKTGDLQKVLKNMEDAVALKHDKKLKTTLGAQLLLLPENKDEVVLLAKTMKKIGLDYFTVKPFSQHPQSKAKLSVDYSESEDIGKELAKIESEKFKIYFRSKSIENLVCEKSYKHCYGLNFMTYMDAAGNIFPCIVFMGKEELVYGNINQQKIDAIWESKRAIKIREIFNESYIKKNCRKTCRLDEINKYLYELKNPSGHVNFI
jgi:GTP 3',8-cyclase